MFNLQKLQHPTCRKTCAPKEKSAQQFDRFFSVAFKNRRRQVGSGIQAAHIVFQLSHRSYKFRLKFTTQLLTDAGPGKRHLQKKYQSCLPRHVKAKLC
eukprot:TRINITY_DN108348_c0_g1_i1.p1 TRINITY_DN108348_c0_g1~~TRINITY_DN108348_c0_g1_i1.p1  ORF type:complete len:115 (-),score=19.25 TRINITY_DN108348_c0_g1_i1:41-334(-)